MELDFRSSTDTGLQLALERGERAEAALDELGLAPADEQPTSGGLRVGEVRPDSPAARATLMPGALEQSNVNMSEVLVQMVEAQRLFDIRSKLISTARELDEGSASLMRI